MLFQSFRFTSVDLECGSSMFIFWGISCFVGECCVVKRMTLARISNPSSVLSIFESFFSFEVVMASFFKARCFASIRLAQRGEPTVKIDGTVLLFHKCLLWDFELPSIVISALVSLVFAVQKMCLWCSRIVLLTCGLLELHEQNYFSITEVPVAFFGGKFQIFSLCKIHASDIIWQVSIAEFNMIIPL